MAEKNITRREFIKTATIVGVTLPSFLKSCSSSKRPNILFIMSDDHAYQAISCYRSQINKTPNIDRLGLEGIRFDNCFVTNSLCAPSRATILTGKYSHLNGQIDNVVAFDSSQMTFPKLLRAAGYQTALIGKWHLRSNPTGFDYWKILLDQGEYYNPVFNEMGDLKNYTGYVTDLVTDFSLDWLDRRDRQKPFCLLVHHKPPHRDWMPDEKYLRLYNDIEVPIPETFYDNYATRSDAARLQEMTIANHLDLIYDLKILPDREEELTGLGLAYLKILERMNLEQRQAWDKAYSQEREYFRKANLKGKSLVEWKYQRFIKDYLRCVAAVNDSVGRILDYLDRYGLAEDTLVVYTSDNGFFLGEHGWFDKRFMYEESLRIPLIMRCPLFIKPGAVSQEMVLNLDLAPTFLDLAGIKIPPDVQGKSFRKILYGQTPADWRQSIYYHYYEYPGPHNVRRHYGLRTRRYKLIHFYYDLEAWECYDLVNDPNEINNVYQDPGYRKVVEQLKAELVRLQKYYGDSEELAKSYIDR